MYLNLKGKRFMYILVKCLKYEYSSFSHWKQSPSPVWRANNKGSRGRSGHPRVQKVQYTLLVSNTNNQQTTKQSLFRMFSGQKLTNFVMHCILRLSPVCIMPLDSRLKRQECLLVRRRAYISDVHAIVSNDQRRAARVSAPTSETIINNCIHLLPPSQNHRIFSVPYTAQYVKHINDATEKTDDKSWL